MILLKLYFAFFKIGLFSFGGGYAMIPLIQKEIVDINNWLSLQGFLDIVSISQSTPGPVAINSATFVGYQLAGVIGGIIATVGVVSPSLILVWIFLRFFDRMKEADIFNWVFSGIRPMVVALILSAAISLFRSTTFNFTHGIIFVISSVLLYKTKVNSIIWIFVFGLIGIIVF